MAVRSPGAALVSTAGCHGRCAAFDLDRLDDRPRGCSAAGGGAARARSMRRRRLGPGSASPAITAADPTIAAPKITA